MDSQTSTPSSEQQLNAIVYGRVQGVGFRFFVLKNAVELGLKGWVRNLSGGMVEVLAEGSAESLQALLTALRRGPEPAYVREVKYHFSAATGSFSEFDIRF